MVDPLLIAVGGVAEGLATELALELLERQRRRGRRAQQGLTPGRVRRILAGAADRVAETVGEELQGLPDNEWRSAVAAARDTLGAVMPIVVGDALASDLRAERLVEQVRRQTVEVRRSAALGEDAAALYDRVLVATCQQIIRAVVALPGFSVHLQIAAFQDLRDMRRTVDRLAGAGAGVGDAEAPTGDAGAFERRYLDHVVETLGRLELFGVRRGRAPRTESFDTAYVSAAVARSGRRPSDEHDDELTGAGVEAGSSLAEHSRVLLRGGAGAGKTTLLRWLAVDAARATLAGGSAGEVPFFVKLRDFAHEEFPDPEALPATVARVIAAEMPAGWASAQLRAGRALLLVDGLDELEPARRLDARRWLEELVAAYGDVRFVVSTRPFAVPEDWLAAADFVPFDLLPLSPKGIGTFLERWHDAARDEHADDPATLDWLDECEAGLAAQFAARVELRRLAGVPLLCGLLCALYQDRNMHLPRDRKGLYDAALDLLLVRWDEERGVRVDEWPPLSKEEQLVLLQRFAYSMVKNHEIVVSRDDARQRIAHAMRGLRSNDIGAEPVLQRTLERTGLLREPEAGGVQFVHRTFRDYLAAKEVVDAGELAFLVEQAHLDHWHDVVVNAVAHARPHERDGVLRRLVEGNAAARDDARVRSRLQLVAAACLEQADVLDTDEVRALVQEAAARLIPPATLDEADLLARAGTFVLDLLPGPEGLTTAQAASVVRTAAMIGGEGVAERLAAFVEAGAAGAGAGTETGAAQVVASQVVDELLRAWRRSEDPDSYARAVLADVDFGDRRLEVRGWHRVRCLVHLRRLANVVCYGDFADLRPLAAVPSLRRLELIQNEMVRDLAPLAAAGSLRALVLTTGFQFLQDLSPLGATGVDDLGLHLVRADLATLAGTGLRRLVIRDPRIGGEAGLGALPADLPLEDLVVDNLPRSRNLRGIERWPGLVTVACRGLPRDDELDVLAALPALARLTLRAPAAPEPADGVGPLAALASFPALRRLDLEDAPPSPCWTALATALVPEGIEVRLGGRVLAAD